MLSAYIQMASKARGDVETAVGQLLDLANNDPNNVPVLMALAHGFLLLKQTAKARNQLKVSLGTALPIPCFTTGNTMLHGQCHVTVGSILREVIAAQGATSSTEPASCRWSCMACTLVWRVGC